MHISECLLLTAFCKHSSWLNPTSYLSVHSSITRIIYRKCGKLEIYTKHAHNMKIKWFWKVKPTFEWNSKIYMWRMVGEKYLKSFLQWRCSIVWVTNGPRCNWRECSVSTEGAVVKTLKLPARKCIRTPEE